MILCPLQNPCRVTQRFGQRPDVYKQFGLKGHNGVDFAGQHPGELVPVYSPYDAVVHEVGDQGTKGYGRFVRLRTAPNAAGYRRELVLGHLSSIVVNAKQEISLGDSIGIMGNTGFSSGPHLHLGLRRIAPNGSVVDENNGFSGYIDFLPWLLFWTKLNP